MDIRPRKASPILKRNTNPRMPKAILKPLRLKKLMIGPSIVPLIHAIDFVKTPEAPNFSSIIWSVLFWDSCHSVGCGS